jgi:hypothetical protein
MSEDPFVHALTIVGRVIEAGAATHGNGEWLQHPASYYVERAVTHLRPLLDGNRVRGSRSSCLLLSADGVVAA